MKAEMNMVAFEKSREAVHKLCTTILVKKADIPPPFALADIRGHFFLIFKTICT